MTLKQRSYKAFDAIRLSFQASPLCTVLRILLSFIYAIMPTAALAVSTADFVDTASAILKNGRPYGDIFLPLALLLAVLGIYINIGSIIELINARINLSLQQKLKPAVVEKQTLLDFKHIENSDSWELISRVSRDPVKAITEGFAAFMTFMQIIVNVSALLILIAAQVWWAMLIVLAFSIPMFWLSMRAGRKNYQAGRDVEKFNRRTEYLNEVLIGRDAVDERTLFGYGEAISQLWQEQYKIGWMHQLKVTAKTFLVTKGSSMMISLIAILIALTLISPVINGSMSVGMFMGIVSAVFGMANQIGWQMSSSLENISKTTEYMKDLSAFVELSQADGAAALPDKEPISFEKLEFRNVRFQYPSGNRYILDGMSFTLEKGRHYAFVGKNGMGKTTITKLLTGLYTEYEGEILINGTELRQYPASTLKALFSLVYQDFAKYYIPLSDNISLGDVAKQTVGGISKRELENAAVQAGLSNTISMLKNGLDTPLGKIKENGQDLSGGQWQRVAIARSFISRAPVKILDEPTAALDPISESQIYEEFEKLTRNKTTIFISHRLGSTKLADEILVVGNGKIAERGTHEELMKAGGRRRDWF